MNPKRFSTGAMLALITLMAISTVSAEVPFLEERALGGETPLPAGSIVADMDNDGDNDIIAVSMNLTPPSLVVKMLDNNGAVPPSYTIRAVSPGNGNDYSLVYWPTDATVAHINSDEYLDVASCSLGKVSWHRTSAGPDVPATTFINNVVYTDNNVLDSDFLSVAAADLNSDGRTDLVAANNTADEIWFWLNEEDEFDPETIVWTRFTAATEISEPITVEVADVNLDGHLDVVVADADLEGGGLLWLQNDGGATPGFTTHEISAGSGILDFALEDMNADGYPEIFSISGGELIQWWANGGGLTPTFTSTIIPDSITNPLPIAVHDIDRDGDLDVVAGSYETHTPVPTDDDCIPIQGSDPAECETLLVPSNLVWFESDGSYPPLFAEHTISDDSVAQSLTVGDVDGDGDGDILSADAYGDALYVYENRLCSIGFPDRFVASAEMFGANAVHAADLTGNGIPDIVASSLLSSPDSYDVAWFANDGATLPTLAEAELITDDGGRAQSVSSGDIDGDGDIDVLVASEEGNWIRWFENSGSGTPTFTQNTVTTNLFNARDAIAADVDGDGDTDVIGASSSSNMVAWFENDGGTTPIFSQHIVTSSSRAAWSVYAADIDGDGDLDIASAAFIEGKITWHQNNGGIPITWTTRDVFVPEFAPENEDEIFPAAIDIVGTDMDQDGDIDLVAASVYRGKIAWYENDGGATPVFVEHVLSDNIGSVNTDVEGPSSVFAADMDGDGDTDLVVTGALNDRLVWFESDGLVPPTLFPRFVSGYTYGSRDAVVADLNGDGLPDIVNASAIDNSISTFLGVVCDSCVTFDASRDGSLDAQELAWIGRSFGLIRDGESPEEDWWAEIDFDGNGIVDGADLAILGSSGVWGRSVLDCSFTCKD